MISPSVKEGMFLSATEAVPDTDIRVIDTFERGWPRRTVIYAVGDNTPMLIDAGPAASLSLVLASLHALGHLDNQLLSLAITHGHLDHMGAAGLLAKYRGIPVHMSERASRVARRPAEVFASTAEVLGRIAYSWGMPVAMPTSHIRSLAGLPERFIFRESDGHCPGHVMYFDNATGTLFSGDELGVAYPTSVCGRVLVLPCTPPTRTNVDTVLASIDWARSLGPVRIAYSHGGWSANPGQSLDAVQYILTAAADAVAAATVSAHPRAAPDSDTSLTELAYRTLLRAAIEVYGITKSDLTACPGAEDDLRATAAGLIISRRRKDHDRSIN